MNGWFPKINRLGHIASGNAGIWLTYPDGNHIKVSPIGTLPFWIGEKLCYNLNNGTTKIGEDVIPIAYNEYYGSETDRWTGFSSQNQGKTDFYEGIFKTNSANQACQAKYAGYGSIYGFNLAYVAPYQSEQRSLIYNNVLIYRGAVMSYAISLNGIIAWQIAVSTYGRQILTQAGVISIKQDETPVTVFEYLGQSWILTQTQNGLLCYPFGSYYGYSLLGDLYYPDSRVLNNKLMIVGSSGTGELIQKSVDFQAPRQDLRLV